MEIFEDTRVNETTQIDPSRIFQVGVGFFAAKTLLTAVKLELFTVLATQSLTAEEIRRRLGLQERGLYDFLDALVALGFLQRKGIKESAAYSNSPDCEMYLDKCKLTYVGGILEMANNRLYPFWNHLEDALRTGRPQNEIRSNGTNMFDQLYADKNRTREFINAMGAGQTGNFVSFARQFDFSQYKILCDIGGAGAQLSAMVIRDNPHMQCISVDLPPVIPIALENISKMGLADKIEVVAGDFFNDPFPNADVITMGNILHDWGTKDKRMLIRKAWESLPEGGSFVAIENIIDNDRRQNTFGLLMSLNMLIETSEGYDYTFAEFETWAAETGFSRSYFIPLSESTSAAVAVK